jgi:hypothetical protein
MKQTFIVGLALAALACTAYRSNTAIVHQVQRQCDTLHFHCSDTTEMQGDVKLWPNQNGLMGLHCLTTSDGNRIDCCLDSISISVVRQNDFFYGKLHSCYDDNDYSIKLLLSTTNLTIIFDSEEHPFLNDSLEFIQDR